MSFEPIWAAALVATKRYGEGSPRICDADDIITVVRPFNRTARRGSVRIDRYFLAAAAIAFLIPARVLSTFFTTAWRPYETRLSEKALGAYDTAHHWHPSSAVLPHGRWLSQAPDHMMNDILEQPKGKNGWDRDLRQLLDACQCGPYSE